MKEVSLKSNIIFSTLYQILTIITPFLTAPYISRVLGADGIGIYSYTYSIQMYFCMAATLGTISYGNREIARNRDDYEKRSLLFWEIELLTVFTTLVCLAVWFIYIFFQNMYQSCYLILTFNIIAVIFDISWFYSGIERLKYIVIQNSFFKLLSIVAIFLFVKSKEDVLRYIAIIALSALFGNMSMWCYLPRYIKSVSWKKIKILPHFKETLVYFIPTIASSIYTVLDKTLIGVLSKDFYENGYYEQATKIINITKSITFGAINSVLLSRMSYLFSEKNYAEIKKRTNDSLSYIIFMGVGILFGLMGIASRLIPWFFGPGYTQVITLLRILSPIVVIIGISNCVGSHYYTPAGLRTLSTKFIITGSIVNLILNCILIPRYKSYGAAAASVVAELVITILYIRFCDGFITVRQIAYISWKRIIAGFIMFICILSIGERINESSLAVVLEIIIGSLLYFAVLIALNDDIIVRFRMDLRKYIGKGIKWLN